MHLPVYLGLLDSAERTLADAFRQVADGHGEEPDVEWICRVLATHSDRHVEALASAIERYSEHREAEPERLHAEALPGTRSGGVGLLRDLQDLYTLASLVDLTWTVVGQAAQALRDEDLHAVVDFCEGDTTRQLRWLRTRIKQAAPQALVAT